MMFCKSRDTTSGFVAIKNGVEYCYFDMLIIVIGIITLIGLAVIIYYKSREKKK